MDQICDSLRWLGLDWDGPPVFQSKRKSYQLQAIKKLLEEGNAYRCFCSVEELEKERKKAIKEDKGYRYLGKCRNLPPDTIQARLNCADPFCVRIKIPGGRTTFRDMIYGSITVSNSEIDDFIIQRTDRTSTYNMTVVADDSDMKITHVIRGEDHLTNTPKQIVVYQLLGREIPKFAHLPMILGPDKRRLSKRHGAVGVQEFRNRGYLPQAVLNYLALLGWNPDTGEEVFTLGKLTKAFRLEQIQKKAAVYDEKKLHWLSGQHMARESAGDLLKRIQVLNSEWHTGADMEYRLRVLEIQKKRLKTLSEIMENSDFFFEDPVTYDAKTLQKRWRDDSVNHLVSKYAGRLKHLEEWIEKAVESLLREVSEEEGVKRSSLIHATRLALTGVPHGPSLFLLMELLGKETCLRRLEIALNRLPQSSR